MDILAGERAQTLSELRAALVRGEFIAHFQPRVLAVGGAIQSAEALIRWQHPRRGLIYPDQFIGLAESAGLIDALGEIMLDVACAQIARWRADGWILERVSVNVSPLQFASAALPDQVRAALQRHAVPAAHLELEVTESLLVGDASEACRQLAELRNIGVAIALDDFGTGYSSMAMLRQLPIDAIKIDRSFVSDLADDDGALAIARAIVALAGSLNLRLVAEGVETESQAAILRSLGCHELQGYLYSKPVPPSRFERLPGLMRNVADATAGA